MPEFGVSWTSQGKRCRSYGGSDIGVGQKWRKLDCKSEWDNNVVVGPKSGDRKGKSHGTSDGDVGEGI